MSGCYIRAVSATVRWLVVAAAAASFAAPGTAAVAATPEQELVRTYSPIVMVRAQENPPCDTAEEQYAPPTTVNVVLGNPEVKLIRYPPGKGSKRSSSRLRRLRPTSRASARSTTSTCRARRSTRVARTPGTTQGSSRGGKHPQSPMPTSRGRRAIPASPSSTGSSTTSTSSTTFTRVTGKACRSPSTRTPQRARWRRGPPRSSSSSTAAASGATGMTQGREGGNASGRLLCRRFARDVLLVDALRRKRAGRIGPRL